MASETRWSIRIRELPSGAFAWVPFDGDRPTVHQSERDYPDPDAAAFAASAYIKVAFPWDAPQQGARFVIGDRLPTHQAPSSAPSHSAGSA